MVVKMKYHYHYSEKDKNKNHAFSHTGLSPSHAKRKGKVEEALGNIF